MGANADRREKAFFDFLDILPVFLVFEFIISVDLADLNNKITYVRVNSYVYIPGVYFLAGRLYPFFAFWFEFLEGFTEDVPDGVFSPAEECR